MNADEYKEAKRKMQENEDARLAWCIADGQNPKGWTSVPVEVSKTFPHADEVTNELRSAVEVYEFKSDPPSKYFLYINEDKELATTWTGQRLGSVRFGRAFRSNFGDERVPVTVHAVNGFNYVGTYYKSSGNYARVRLAKN